MSNINYTTKRTVLIVDDNKINREILASILADNYNIIIAENGKEGYDILSNEYSKIALILLDVYMPVMNGFEFLEKLKGDELLSSVPVIVTTGSDKASDEVKCLKLGAADFITKPYNPEIVVARVHSIIKLKESVSTLSSVEFDELTGLYTMPAFYHHVKELIQANPDKSFDICVADIKDFKLIRSVYGKNKSDELIKYIAEKYKSELKYAVLARISDHFFALYESGVRFDPELAKKYHDDLIENAPISYLTIKYGIYANVDEKLTIATCCDRAMLAAQSIKNNFSVNMAFYDGKFEEKMIENQQLEQSFEQALNDNEFVAYYQPKIDPNTEKIVGAEALVRWITPKGMISPGAFVPLFETDGLITRLDEHIFITVCKYQRMRMDAGKKVVPISVNLSRNSIYTKNIGEQYKKIAESYNVDLRLVPIEITESATTGSKEILRLANNLVQLGFTLHMDDFGTGYSSLDSLAKMPFSVLKLDKSLVDQIGQKKGDILIRHIISFAQEMGILVVAEGAEERTQVDFLRYAGCDMIQGYYYSKPLSETAFTEMFDNEKQTDINLNEEYQNIQIVNMSGLEYNGEDLDVIKKLADEMMEGFLIYKASSDETILYANIALANMFGCGSVEEFKEYTSNSFKGIVDKDDYDEVEKSIFIQLHQNGNCDQVEYHITRKDGSKVYVSDRGHCVNSSLYGNIFYVFIKEK